MLRALVQIQAHAMLKTPQAEQTSTPYCVEHSRAMGDRCVGIDEVNDTCKHQQSLELDQTHTHISSQPVNNHDFPFWQFTLPGCALILAAMLCRTAIQMREGRFKLKLTVKDWLGLQAEIDKSVVVNKHQDQ